MTPSSAAIFGHDRPEARRVAILAASTFTLGRPSVFPFDFAAAMPDLTRSRISSLSNSAMLANAKHKPSIRSTSVHAFVQADEFDSNRAKSFEGFTIGESFAQNGYNDKTELANGFDEFGGFNLQSVRQLYDVQQTDIPFTALDSANVVAMQVGQLR
jgi:hypothetical protein